MSEFLGPLQTPLRTTRTKLHSARFLLMGGQHSACAMPSCPYLLLQLLPARGLFSMVHRPLPLPCLFSRLETFLQSRFCRAIQISTAGSPLLWAGFLWPLWGRA